MASSAGAGQRVLLWLFRAVQFVCAGYILAVSGYLISRLHHASLPVPSAVAAVAGLSAAATLYTLAALLLLCCLAGIPVFSLLAIVLDIVFVGCFIYIAWANRLSRGFCFNPLDPSLSPYLNDRFAIVDYYHRACNLQTASLGLAIVAIFFFVFSLILEAFILSDNQDEKAFGPGPHNEYTSGSRQRSAYNLGFVRGRRSKGPATYPEQTLEAPPVGQVAPEQTMPGPQGPPYTSRTTRDF